jgi:acyl-CoA synthetase (AMP-forming)/AMP-acid ligase II
MESFKAWLSGWHVQEPVWVSAGGSIMRADFLRVLECARVRELVGKRVALGKLSAIEFAATLVALDGIAETILVLPGDEQASIRARWIAEARIDTVLDGSGLGLQELMSGEVHESHATAASGRLQTSWLLATSGTTGTPKLIRHTLTSLTRTLASRPARERFRWGSLYSLRRFAGLQVLLQAFAGGSALIIQDDDLEFSGRIEELVREGCNALSATPSTWRKLAMHPGFEELQLRQITLGGEIVDQNVLDLLARRFPQARITHIYASTEAGVGFAVRDGRAGFPVSYLQDAPGGVEMKIDEAAHLCFYTDAWVDSGDVVRVDAGRVYFLGRANGSINVGGNKVMPEEVEAIISELPEVAFANVRARRNPITGNLVEATVLLVPGMCLDLVLKKKIIAHCRERLDGFKVPAFVVEAKDIPLTLAGKLSRS